MVILCASAHGCLRIRLPRDRVFHSDRILAAAVVVVGSRDLPLRQRAPGSFSRPELRGSAVSVVDARRAARVQQYVLDALERVPAPQREAAIAALSRQLEVELPETHPRRMRPCAGMSTQMARQA